MNDLILAAVECAPTEEVTWPVAAVFIAVLAAFAVVVWANR